MARILGKILGGGLGFAFGGPIGALLGVAVGSMLDMGSSPNARDNSRSFRQNRQTTQGDFVISLLVLSASVMKADGKILKSELDYIKRFLVNQFGEDAAQEQLILLRDILKKDIPLRDVCEQIRTNVPHPARLQMLHFLFGIAQADSHVDTAEVNIIQRISNYLGIRQADFDSLKAMFYKDVGAAYTILEITPQATDEDVKKAYRKMALKYHPDRLGNLAEDLKKGAEEKFRKVQEAYETIQKERGFK